jgi:hypothetical protein
MKILRGLACSGILVFFLAGCTAQLTAADRDLMNQAIDSANGAAVSAEKAEASALSADGAANRAEAAAVNAENAAARAEAAANRAAQEAAAAEDSALKAEKAFEMGLRK